nr:MAG TPA: hypothetical protein [Caudoviricetes sp.]
MIVCGFSYFCHCVILLLSLKFYLLVTGGMGDSARG